MKLHFQIIGILVFCMLNTFAAEAQEFSFEKKEILSIVDEVEEDTSYLFLYREPLLAGIELSFTANRENLFHSLEKALQPYNIGLSVDSIRNQILIYELKPPANSHSVNLSGFVVDHQTGERLPFATITWKAHENREGVAASQGGWFSIKKDYQQEKVLFTFSYVGYNPKTIVLDLTKKQDWSGITIRLEPTPFSSSEIIVNGVTYFNPADTVFSGLLETGNFSPLGENNSVRALQTLPAVNFSSALNDGINVRGSSVNGFKVLLDGVSVFNQSHLFGLVDSFNPDVLQSRGFFYDVTPAQFESPSGGTLALITRTGSLQEYGATIGSSNTAYRVTVQGPIVKGQSSFLISGRRAYMNTIDWFNNRNLIEFGLNINRPSSTSQITETSLDDFLIDLGNYDASFYDLHGKFYYEGRNGDRFQLSGYLGNDNTQQMYNRCFIRSSDNLCPIRFNDINRNFFRLAELETENERGNNLASASYQYQIGSDGFAETLVGFSDYNSSYFKDDYTYQRQTEGQRETILRPYGIENSLTEFKLKQSFDFSWPTLNFHSGITYFNYHLEYFEDSIRRLNYFDKTTVSQIDLAVQLDLDIFDDLNLRTGSRLHFYSAGNYIRWSPGIKFYFYPTKPISFSAGFSRTHQFLNQIGLSNINTSDIWIATSESQSPTQSDLFSTGLYLRFSPTTYIRLEGFLKQIKNMRLHESQTRFIPATIESDVPWYYQNDLSSMGVEFLFRHKFDDFSFSQSYTLSTVQVENPRINNGSPFHPEWDRRHQLYSILEFHLSDHIQLHASSTFATGPPNQLFKILEATGNPSTIELSERLNNYHRLDLSLELKSLALAEGIEVNIYIFNLLNRKNDWYREFGVFVEEDRNAPLADRYSTIGLPVSVYDLGFQPSFNVKLKF